MIDKNEQLTMDELLFSMKQKYNDLDITRRHLGRVIRANNRTRKRTRHQHYPKEVGKPSFPLRPLPLIISINKNYY